jgi:hypothetical protein
METTWLWRQSLSDRVAVGMLISLDAAIVTETTTTTVAVSAGIESEMGVIIVKHK